MSFTDGILTIPLDDGGEVDATLNGSGWSCDDPATLTLLNRLFPVIDNPFVDYSPVNPCVPCDLMAQVERVMGATIKQRPKSTLPPDTIF